MQERILFQLCQRKKGRKKMGKKLVLVLTLLAVVGLWAGSSAGTGKSEPAMMNRGPNLFQLSPSSRTPLLKEGEKVLNPLLAPSPDDTIHYDGTPDANAIGLTNGGTFQGAIRLTPAELGSYTGWQIVAVIWYHHEAGSHGDSVIIYDQGTDSTPGPVLTSDPCSDVGAGWIREDLSSPVPISGLGDLWCSIMVTHAMGEFPLSIDAGPAVQGKGDFVYLAPNWDALWLLGFDSNWDIRAIVDSGGAAIQFDVRPLSLDNPIGMIPPGIPLQPEATVRNQGQQAATFDLVCEIDSSGSPVYVDTFSFVDLPASSDSSVTFTDAWTPGPSGSIYDVTLYTNLGSDEVPGNDTLMGMTFAFDAAILPILSPWATSAPAIDGVISVGEWDDAIRLDVSDVLGMPDGFDLPGSAILYVKNDSSNLYMACDAPPDPSATDWDQVGLYFDDNHDGAWPSASDSSEGNLWYQQFATGDVVDWRWIWGAGPDSFGTPRTVPFPFQCTPTSGNMQYEMTCPIGALGEELNAAPGDTVGFFLYVMDVGANAMLGWWPYDVDATTGWSDPSVYGDLVLGDAPVGVEETHVRNRDRLSILLTAKPNPVTSAADILYQIPDRSKVSLTIYDVTGSVVRTLVNTTEDAGQHHVTWDGKDNAGFDVSTGPYFCLLSAGNETATGKLILLR